MTGSLRTIEVVAVVGQPLRDLQPGAQALERFNAGELAAAIELARLQIVAPSCSDVIKLKCTISSCVSISDGQASGS